MSKVVTLKGNAYEPPVDKVARNQKNIIEYIEFLLEQAKNGVVVSNFSYSFLDKDDVVNYGYVGDSLKLIGTIDILKDILKKNR